MIAIPQNNVAVKRCAVYTRKSNENGLEQEFNSLDAQRDAAENYIASQKANGWQLLPEKYDDGGFSGGNMERPALKKLLANVKAGLIDIIVVYKLDRLSRSLLDFMKLAEMLEQHNVSFVSVTQDINTSTSAGRMMLNILMTFSEYERLVIGERIRDKVAGAKRRGKYCGGPPLLGYDLDGETKKLIINKSEAKTVKLAFESYARTGSSLKVAMELNEKGLRTKNWKSKKGKIHPGNAFDQGVVQRMVSNQVYIGKVHHRGEYFNGEHKGIIDQNLWDNVQALLAENRTAEGYEKSRMESPFKGLLKCGYCGGSLGITYTQKHDRRYTYYVCIKDDKKAISECPLSSLPTGEVDRMILQQLSTIFKTPTMLANVYSAAIEDMVKNKKELLERKTELAKELVKMKAAEMTESMEFQTIEKEIAELETELKMHKDCELSRKDISDAFESLEGLWEELFPVERYRLAHLLIEKIAITRNSMKVEIKTHGVKSLVMEIQAGNPEAFPDPECQTLMLEIPIKIKHKHGRKVIIAPESEIPENQTPVQETIFQALSRAHTWLDLIESGEVATVTQLAEKLNLDKSYVGKIFRLVNLAPDIQEAIIRGDEPDGLSLNRLRELVPAEWDKQREIFGIR